MSTRDPGTGDGPATVPIPSCVRVVRLPRAPALTDERLGDCLFMLSHLTPPPVPDPALDVPLASAFAGSAYSPNSPNLTPRQLIGEWRHGRLCWPLYRDERGSVVNNPLYLVGCGGSVLSGDWRGWGIDPARPALVFGDGDLLPPESRVGFKTLMRAFMDAAAHGPDESRDGQRHIHTRDHMYDGNPEDGGWQRELPSLDVEGGS